MEPNLKYPFSVRSFFTPDKKKDIKAGLELWQGYFQSLRPSQNSLYVNIDISTGVMYKPIPLINLCLEFLRKNNPGDLNNISDRDRVRLQRFLTNVRIETRYGRRRAYAIKKLSRDSARTLEFSTRDGASMSVETYFKSLGVHLTYPLLPCVEVCISVDSIQNAHLPVGGTQGHDSHGTMLSSSRTTYEEAIPWRQDQWNGRVCQEEACRSSGCNPGGITGNFSV